MIPPASPRPLTIGFLRRGYSATGGVEAYLKGLAKGLLGEGHRVILFGTAEWPREEWPGGEILRCSGTALKGYIKEVARRRKENGIRCDLILSVEKVPGCDLFRTDEGLHASWLAQRSQHISPWARWFQKKSFRHREKLMLEKQIFSPHSTRRVISLSEKISGELTAIYGYPAGQISMIRNGVRSLGVPSLEQREESRRQLGIAPEEKISLFVGTGWERKGLRFAIQAVENLAAENPTIKLLVAGNGPSKRYASSSVRFLGEVKEMASLYCAADHFLLPTLFDPFPLAALEALGSGLPIITTAANGVSEVMTPGLHGEVIADPSDVEALAGALRKWVKISEDPERIASARTACAALASDYTLERNLRETLAVIHEVMAEKKASPSQKDNASERHGF